MTAITYRAAELNSGADRAGMPTATWADWSCTVRLVVSDRRVLQRAAADVVALMAQVERAASRFRHDSELSRANARAGRPLPVSRTLVDLVDGALAAARVTGGAVDPTVGADLVRLGYDRDMLLVTDSDSAPEAGPAHRRGWREVRLDRATGLLTVPAGSMLDLGATAKAQTADWAAKVVHARYGCNVLVEIGGDLAVAGAKRDWQVVVAEREGAAGQQVSLDGGGLATSTTTIRRWHRAGRLVHHIVDPATGAPADGTWRTVSVAADSALAANVQSTAAIVKGEAAIRWLQGQHAAARLVGPDGVVTRVGAWPC